MAEVARVTAQKGTKPPRGPPFWGGFRIRPVEIEFWPTARSACMIGSAGHATESGRR